MFDPVVVQQQGFSAENHRVTTLHREVYRMANWPYTILLLSGKTQKDILILPEALYNKTSGVYFQKASPP